MNIFAPSYMLATTTFGAGVGVFVWSGPSIERMVHDGIAPAVVGAAFGALMGGAGLLMSPNPNEPRRSILWDVYKDLLKIRYRVVKQYESNRTARVVWVLEREDNTPVVLKLPNPNIDRDTVSSRSDEIRREYQTIIEITSATHSSHIVKVIDSFSGGDRDDGYFIAILEYVSGPTLREEMNKELLTLARVKQVFPGLAEGLRDVYKAGYDHADLKPENVILNPERGAVLIDFQFANPTDEFKWSLRAWCKLLYESLTGDGIFNPEETVRNILEKRNALSSSEVEDAEALQKIIDRALGRNGISPYPDMDTFVEEVNQWQTSTTHS